MRNRSRITEAGAYLMDRSDSFSGDLSENIKSGRAQLSRHTIVVRKNVTNAGGTIRIIDENTKKIDGVSTLSNTKLPKNMAVVFDKIAIAVGEADAENEEATVNYVGSAAPAVARNSTLVISQNGREVLELPVSDLVKTISPGSPEDYFHDLESFAYLVDDQEIDWFLRLPNGKTLEPSAAGKQVYLEARVQGFKTAKRL